MVSGWIRTESQRLSRAARCESICHPGLFIAAFLARYFNDLLQVLHKTPILAIPLVIGRSQNSGGMNGRCCLIRPFVADELTALLRDAVRRPKHGLRRGCSQTNQYL